MFSKTSILFFAALMISQATVFASYQMHSETTESYISVREVSPDAFEVLFCQQGAAACVNLGNKKTYSMEELKSLKSSEMKMAGLTGATAAATVLVGAWLGAVGGGILGFKYLATAAAINASATSGAIAGVAITSTGIGFMDRMNPLKHYKTAKLIAKMTTSQDDYVSDVDSQARWIHSRLNKIK